MGRKIYPSDVSREQFEIIRPMLESAKHRTAPRKVDLYDVFCAILYLLKNGSTCTPFFIRPERGHGDFWLLHLSQHWKARDVMASTHWRHHNHFSHYGDAGFHMFSTGYISKINDGHKLQAGFDFSEVAATVSKETMMEQIPAMLFDGAEGMTFEQFFLKLINTTPATRDMVEATLLELHQSGEIVVVDESGAPSKARTSLKGNHVLRLPSQRSFLFF